MPQEVTVLYSMAKYTQDLERERDRQRDTCIMYTWGWLNVQSKSAIEAIDRLLYKCCEHTQCQSCREIFQN